jgi:hypothetical protein
MYLGRIQLPKCEYVSLDKLVSAIPQRWLESRNDLSEDFCVRLDFALREVTSPDGYDLAKSFTSLRAASNRTDASVPSRIRAACRWLGLALVRLLSSCAQANNLQQSWRFDWEPPKAVLRDVRTIDWILGRLRSSAQADPVAGRPVLGF